MKKLYLLFAFAAFLFTISCSQSSGKAAGDANGAMIEFETTQHNFGTIPEGGDGTFDFVFTSKGKEPLILKNVRPTCGCTISEWPKEPIKSGEKGIIKIKYNTHLTGNFTKSINVYSNATEEPVLLVIKGKVEAAAK
jgi:hypothetical protein